MSSLAGIFQHLERMGEQRLIMILVSFSLIAIVAITAFIDPLRIQPFAYKVNN
jgi:hypothetical protein